MNRDYAEKQDLWAEMSELWTVRQTRKRKARLGVMAAVSVLIMAGAFVYNVSTTSQDPMYLQVQGNQLGMEKSVNASSAPDVDQREKRVEFTETLSI
ncbi:hypothetical protein [Desulfuromonas acetoxidans]|uniref:Uncharacterized protein n=1 Tax=Desulfuromonas acetoxidans (strain DSM 684 / 11070) TaxID=281689 RepID=Q1JXA8_DESA6|nr:hypothetical protein [Desulfuromonas acetoxidans]EAT14884.1 hypothetical protein Dace_0893 [Desulfuromonas acetoxidans DSM 684]MBF0646852.1 hypothetical protein [Desulfuromonas acetoxidans]NVD23344.1 hypothetical protein [Desulfuromonas acetoxidans]NVE15415.1 hypothetical protein [Desulfuromonas acetoxidans]